MTGDRGEVFALRAAAAQARRIVAHYDHPESNEDWVFLARWRTTATWLERRAEALLQGLDPDVVADPGGMLTTKGTDASHRA